MENWVALTVSPIQYYKQIYLPNISVSQVLLSEASGSDLPSAGTSLSEELSKMSTSSSIGLMAQGEAAPPMGGKTEESIRGQMFKVLLNHFHKTCSKN